MLIACIHAIVDSDSEVEPDTTAAVARADVASSDPKEWDHLRKSDPVSYALKMRAHRPIIRPTLKCT